MNSNKFNLLILLLCISAGKIYADDVWCDNKITARSGASSMLMDCGDGVKGNIADINPLKKIKINLTKRNGKVESYILDNPPGDIRDYDAIEYNDWVTKQLSSALAYGDKISVADNGYLLDDSSVLYYDNDMKERAGTIKELKTNGAQAKYTNCEFGPYTNIISYPSACGENKICAGEMLCNYKGQRVSIFGACAAVNGECPTAGACVDDQNVLVKTAENKAPRGFGGDNKANSGAHNR